MSLQHEYETDLAIIKDKITKFIDLAEKYAKSYFWSASTSPASARRSQETRDTFGDFNFRYENDVYELSASLSISCKNYYYTKSIYKNGVKTNMRVLRTILKKLEAN